MKEQAWATAKRLSQMHGDETIPTEDVIDLAQAVLYLLERVDGDEPDHAAKDCWMAGGDGHLRCTPPDLSKSHSDVGTVCQMWRSESAFRVEFVRQLSRSIEQVSLKRAFRKGRFASLRVAHLAGKRDKVTCLGNMGSIVDCKGPES